MERFTLTATTDASGDATVFAGPVWGLLHTIVYTKVDFDNGVDFAITIEGTAEAVWTESNVDATATRAPRQATHDVVGVASLYAAGGEPVEDLIALADDRIKIVVSSGGDTKTGTFHVIIQGA